MQNLSYDDFLELEIPSVPLVIQRQVVNELKARMETIDASKADAVLAIDLTKERRAALISAAVAGRIDVTARKRVVV